MKKRIITICAVVLLLLVMLSLTSCDVLSGDDGLSGNIPFETEAKTPRLTKIYNTYCSGSSCAKVGADGSYLSIDTNPYNRDDYTDSKAITLINNVNEELDLPDYLLDEMSKTNSLMGRRTETFDKQGISVSWSYHPDNGLEVTYKDIR